jgi:hypothetical protein
MVVTTLPGHRRRKPSATLVTEPADRQRIVRPRLVTGHDCRMPENWPSRHFSLANPLKDGGGDLPRLLRRVADAIEDQAIQPDEILDLTISSDTTDSGPWWSATVYWSPGPED